MSSTPEKRPADPSGTASRAEALRPEGVRGTVEGELSLLEILAVLVRQRRLILGWGLLVAIVVAAVTLASGRTYTSEGSFMPQASERAQSGGLAQMAGQFGLSLPPGNATESPSFYVELLHSQVILQTLTIDTFEVTDRAWLREEVRRAGTLTELLDLQDEDPERERARTIRWLKENGVSASITRGAGIVRVSVRTPWPELSQDVAQRLLELVHDFNLITRQNQAAAERAFIEGRIAETERRLQVAEDELKRFLEANRQIQGSPQLVFQHDRLERQVAMRQQLLTSLRQRHEDARISEVRNTPLITVVEEPNKPAWPDRRRLPLKALVALAVGMVVGMFHAATREFLLQPRLREDEGFRKLQSAWSEASSGRWWPFGRRVA